MKSYMRIILLTATCLMIFACSKKSEEDKVVGKWKIEMPAEDPDIVIIEYMSNGNYIIEVSTPGDPETHSEAGTWKLLKDPLRFVGEEDGRIDTMKIKFITDDKIKFSKGSEDLMTINRIKE